MQERVVRFPVFFLTATTVRVLQSFLPSFVLLVFIFQLTMESSAMIDLEKADRWKNSPSKCGAK
jgi:hypothetical protein